MLTESGFPKNIKNASHLLRVLYKRKAHYDPVKLHRNSEPGTGRLHNAMWALQKAGDIEIIHNPMPKDSPHINDTQFLVRIEMASYEKLKTRKLMVYTAVISTVSVAVSLMGLAWHIHSK